jgi:6-phospho-3-hexuloisomerase
MKGLAMRLFHAGFDAHVVGEVAPPPVAIRDLLIVSARPGDFATISALLAITGNAGAKAAVVTAGPDSATAADADHVLTIPAQTMAGDQGERRSVLPMGSLFEASMLLTFELLVLRLRALKGESAETARASNQFGVIKV